MELTEAKRTVLSVIDIVALDKTNTFYCLVLEKPQWKWVPGQFIMLRPLSWMRDPFLPRPFSIANINDFLYIYFQVVGKGTRLLSLVQKGDEILVWGPLGNGFKFDVNENLLLLAGGMGIVPFLGLVTHHPSPDKLELVFGHRHSSSCYPIEEISNRILTWSIRDNSEEDLEKLKKAIKVKIENYAKDGLVFACGPRPFLKMVQDYVLKYKARAQLSLETVMACGIGVCLGCAIRDRQDGFVQVCKKGPVFEADSVYI